VKQWELNNHIARLKEQLAVPSATIGKLQKMVYRKHEHVTEKTEEVAEVEKAKAVGLCQQAERESQVENYETAHSRLKRQCEDHRCDLENVSQELSEAGKRFWRQQTMIIRLKRSQNELQKKLMGLTKESDRAVQTSESLIINAPVTAESGAAEKIQEVTVKFENEKSGLFSLLRTNSAHISTGLTRPTRGRICGS
jgi:chromosome segregation ATPase